jgi:dTDP-4-amino-4,6-dideoxygalactose transaminase
MNKSIPFNKPYLCGKELENIRQAHLNGQLAGDGKFTKECEALLEQLIGCKKALLTHSCTGALEMAAILANIGPGDEVIMPSYTFVSTANPFVLRGAIPVFVDIRSDTLNINEDLIESVITKKTRAIVPVHYAGVGCEMDSIMQIANQHNLVVIEDAAQGIGATYKSRPLGSIGHIGAMSFHETKNVMSGEGGALLVNDPQYIERAEIIREKGTNRNLFFRNQVDKYTWVDCGSSYLPGEIIGAFLSAQLKELEQINSKRLLIWKRYHEAFKGLEESGRVKRPMISEFCGHNAHMYYLILKNSDDRDKFINAMKERGISAVFHYVPLHTSPYGLRISKSFGKMINTEDLSERLVRLPLWIGIDKDQEYVIETALDILKL